MIQEICFALSFTVMLGLYDPASAAGRGLVVALLLAELFAVSAMLYHVTHDPVVATLPAAGLMLTCAWRLLRRAL